MLQYAITDGNLHAGDAERWVAASVDFVQLRAATLPAGELRRRALQLRAALAAAVHSAADSAATAGAVLPKAAAPRLLINSRADVALAAAADGVHLTARQAELSPADMHALYAHRGLPPPTVSVSCHSVDDVRRAAAAGAALMLFAPVFEKRIAEVVTPGVGLDALRHAAQAVHATPGRVLALGGVTRENTAACLAAGAAGVAGIRLFLEAVGSAE